MEEVDAAMETADKEANNLVDTMGLKLEGIINDRIKRDLSDPDRELTRAETYSHDIKNDIGMQIADIKAVAIAKADDRKAEIKQEEANAALAEVQAAKDENKAL